MGNVLAKGDQGDTTVPRSHFSTRFRYGQNGFSFHRFSHLTANPWEMPIRYRIKGTNSRKGKTKNSQIKISQLNGWWFSYWKRCAIPPPPLPPLLRHYIPFGRHRFAENMGLMVGPPTQLFEATMIRFVCMWSILNMCAQGYVAGTKKGKQQHTHEEEDDDEEWKEKRNIMNDPITINDLKHLRKGETLNQFYPARLCNK